ncbi:MAG: hypothetical protein IJO65_05565 [Lachnospiraceae bacterium]|nr:hypothetical protein [Lachnospiraceae bacterium]
MDFNELNDSFLIMVAPFDLFGKGLYRYTFEGTCRECPELKLGDGALKIFINTNGTNKEAFSEEFLDFMEYLKQTNDETAKRSKSKRIKKIHEQVKKVKASEKIGVKYMQLWEEMALARQEAKEEGISEGRLEGQSCKLIEQICKKIRKGYLPEQIAESLEEELSMVQSVYQTAQQYAPEYEEEKVLSAWMSKREILQTDRF